MNFNIGVRNGLLDIKHLEKLGIAIWLYLWLIDHQVKGSDKVLGGKPISYDDIKDTFPIPKRTYERWMNIIRIGGYIDTIRTPYGLIVNINKPKKWARDMPKVAQPDVPDVAERYAKSGGSYVKSGTSNKTIQLDNTITPTYLPSVNKKWFDKWKQITGLDQRQDNVYNQQALGQLLKRFSEEELEYLIKLVAAAQTAKYAGKVGRIADYVQLRNYADDLRVWAKNKVSEQTNNVRRIR